MKLLVKLVKWLPFALMVLMVLHCVLLLIGIDEPVLSHASVSPLLYVVMLVMSYKLGFCKWHRMALHYDFVVWLCVLAKEYGLLENQEMLQVSRVSVMTIGIIIATATITAKSYDGC